MSLGQPLKRNGFPTYGMILYKTKSMGEMKINNNNKNINICKLY